VKENVFTPHLSLKVKERRAKFRRSFRQEKVRLCRNEQGKAKQ
jgi:hypothetical protein